MIGLPGHIWQLLMALNECGLKNDAMLDTFYEEFGQRYRTDKSYAIYFFHGSYDVPLKASRGNMALPFTCMIAGWIVVAVLYRKRCGDAQGINYGLEQLHIVVALKGSLDILKP